MAISGTTALIIAGIVAAAAAGAGAYMTSEAQAAQARERSKMAQMQEEAEANQALAARKSSRLKSRRLLNSQASKAGGAGVVAGEGSLFTNQMEAASLSKYEEDLAAYGHEISSNLYGYESKLFKHDAIRASAMAPYNGLLAAGSSAAGSYAGGSFGGGGTTVATAGGGGTMGGDVSRSRQ